MQRLNYLLASFVYYQTDYFGRDTRVTAVCFIVSLNNLSRVSEVDII